ncbi:hypothetical protein CDL12_16706 [Handroanthus impetiginosus]|uniref:Dof zinc finger protein n=1 Tax=Handroanthus impetiginosus TaxID=429701 RepID=A0A2G9GZJ8_9LAMI|nr:hypothetical protein CDL12_16706 [Handroanthus impetiginosus]
MTMESSTAQSHHQEIMGSQTLESMLICTKPQQEKKPRPSEQSLKCPRCESTNTKFCYYNNYSLSQPRYFCKSCRRYWTKGGTLRNVPVGGGCRKNKRSSSSSSSNSSSSSKRSHDQQIITSPIPAFSDFSISGHPNMPLIGDALRGGFLDQNPFGFHEMWYGTRDGVSFGMENGGMGMSGSQEMWNNVGQSRGLGGFPWLSVSGADGNVAEPSWNGIGSGNWHGLLNSPLM